MASGKILEAEVALADLLAYGPTMLAVRKAVEKATPKVGE